MRNRSILFIVLILAGVFVLNAVGCSGFSKPKDEEVIKAIDGSGALKGKGFTVTSPLVIVERGKRNADGSWPVRVKMTLTMLMPDGKISEPKENITPFKIYKVKDKTGREGWKAILGN